MKILKNILRYYKLNWRRVLTERAISAILFFCALAVVGLKTFYPHHLIVGAALLIASFGISVYHLFFQKGCESSLSGTIMGLIKEKRRMILLAITGILAVYITLSFLSNQTPFEDMDDEDLAQYIAEEIQESTILLDNLEISGLDLITDDSFLKNNLSIADKERLQRRWDIFLSSVIESERMTEVHKSFAKISLIKNPDENFQSFMIAYSLYLKKYELFHMLVEKTKGRDDLKKILNEKTSLTGVEGGYSSLSGRLLEADTILKINAGKAYSALIERQADARLSQNEYYIMLREDAKNSYRYLYSNLNATIEFTLDIGSDHLEKKMFDAWFPVQKNTASLMGETYLSRRHEKFITADQINIMKEEMDPGDIMVQRRNWYASNIGIPGFWPHAALYTGSLEEMEDYFKDCFPYEGAENMQEYLLRNNPSVLRKLLEKDAQGFEYSVIEGMAPGIILQSLEKSAHADYVGVIRPKLEKQDKLASILRAFENYGKPYDYDFDFETRDKLVCSELVYDAYLETNQKKGISFELSTVSGRKMISPTDMVRKFYEESEQEQRQLDFVYFLDGNEQLGRAFAKGEEEFIVSWTRPKYDWDQE